MGGHLSSNEALVYHRPDIPELEDGGRSRDHEMDACRAGEGDVRRTMGKQVVQVQVYATIDGGGQRRIDGLGDTV